MSEIRKKQKKVQEQGYAAARQNKIFPRELQNTTNGSWEDAKLYSMNTRQGQNYWQGHMKDMSKIQRPKQTRTFDVQNWNRATAPTPPTASPVPKQKAMSEQQRRKRNEIADKLLKKRREKW